jgi:hypothetical protein
LCCRGAHLGASNPDCQIVLEKGLPVVLSTALWQLVRLSRVGETSQVISLLGALAILAVYAANQFGLVGPSNICYSVVNFVGSAMLTVIAVIEVQWDFIPLEGV